jgi:hypothetical protein
MQKSFRNDKVSRHSLFRRFVFHNIFYLKVQFFLKTRDAMTLK